MIVDPERTRFSTQRSREAETQSSQHSVKEQTPPISSTQPGGDRSGGGLVAGPQGPAYRMLKNTNSERTTVGASFRVRDHGRAERHSTPTSPGFFPGGGAARGVAALNVTCLAVLALVLVIPHTLADDAVMPSGFREVVFSVSDLEGAAKFYQEVAGWNIVYLGSGDTALAKHWGLAENQIIRQALLTNPGDDRGFLRLVAFPGAAQQQIRSSAQTWDTGGIFDVNVRVLDIHEKFAELRKRGWQFYSDPIQFHFGPFVVWEVLAKGPDGVVFAMVERVQPPLEGWPHLRELSQIFNSTQIVADFSTSLEFYRDKLGFQIYLEHEGPSKEAGPNVLALPHNLATEIPRKVVILSPDGGNSGSVELIGFDGITGADHSGLAEAPNLGILALRFPVADLAAYQKRLAENGVEPVNGPSTLTIEPYGEVEIMTIRAPEGAWLEFYQPPEDGGDSAEEE